MLKPELKLQTHVSLRQLELRDIPALRLWYYKDEVSEYFRHFSPEFTWGNDGAFLAGIPVAYVIEENGAVIGIAQLTNGNASAKTVEMGMMIDADLCLDRKAAAFKAHELICKYIFDYLGFNKIIMKTLTTRHSLRERMVKFGYTLEGTLKSNCRFNDSYRDEWIFGLLQADFKLGKGK